MEDYTRTDLACESAPCGGLGTEVREERIQGFSLIRLTVHPGAGEQTVGKPAGEYLTVNCGKIWELEPAPKKRLVRLLAKELSEMVERLTQKQVNGKLRVLIAGLGNSDITPDAVGPDTVRRITVTRALAAYDRELFDALGCAEISALAPGVYGQTGLESVDLLLGAAERSQPDLVIAIDALAARSCERLAATVQLSDCGIAPGSGIGNNRRAINRANLGVPVLSVGVPTVVDSATLVYDALGQAGIGEDEIGDSLRAVLENGKKFYVSPKESDRITECVSEVLAAALNRALGCGNIASVCGI